MTSRFLQFKQLFVSPFLFFPPLHLPDVILSYCFLHSEPQSVIVQLISTLEKNQPIVPTPVHSLQDNLNKEFTFFWKRKSSVSAPQVKT